jgi:uncharacterized protein YgiM (DUF1202 family)
MGRRLIISCVILAALTACQPASVSVAGNIVSATNRPLVCLVIADSLYVREGPGVEYPVVGYLHYGEIVEVAVQAQAADGGAWAQIERGWINRRWLECIN